MKDLLLCGRTPSPLLQSKVYPAQTSTLQFPGLTYPSASFSYMDYKAIPRKLGSLEHTNHHGNSLRLKATGHY